MAFRPLELGPAQNNSLGIRVRGTKNLARVAGCLADAVDHCQYLHEYQVRYWGKKKSTIAESTEQKFSNLARSNPSSI